jgi:hypothetical protein
VYDTGAPTITLRLSANSKYPQAGVPEDASSFPGTAVRLVGSATKPAQKPKTKPKTKAKHKPKAKAKPKSKPKAKPKSKPKAKPKSKPKAKPKTKSKHKPRQKPPAARPPAFTVPGAKPEPLDEMPLPARARLLGRWVSTHPSPTDANVRYWLYQHAWIVTGARLGWWHGAQALEELIAVDRRVQRLWGIGARSEALARSALADVRRKSK